MPKIKLGAYVRDKISGFEGTVLGRTEWLFGCVTYGVKSSELKDGKPVENVWFDEDQLEVLPKKKAATPNKVTTGGPTRPGGRGLSGV